MNFKFNAGELRTPIVVMRSTTEKNEDNIPVKIDKEVLKCKAKVSSFKGKSEKEGQGEIYIDDKKLILRKPPKFELLDTDTVYFNNKNYSITSINDIEERGRYYELKVRYVK